MSELLIALHALIVLFGFARHAPKPEAPAPIEAPSEQPAEVLSQQES